MDGQAGARYSVSGSTRADVWAFVLSLLLHGLVLGASMGTGRAVTSEPIGQEIEVRLIERAREEREDPVEGRRASGTSTVSQVTLGGEAKPAGDAVHSDLHYRTFYDENPNHPMRCMVGHVAESSGDHDSAIYIYEDCANNGDNFSMISLAHYYELGLGGAPRDPARAVELFRKVATSDREAYRSNGMFYYGLSLYFGYGVGRDRTQARLWLRRAAEEGVGEAAEFLKLAANGKPPPPERYFKR